MNLFTVGLEYGCGLSRPYSSAIPIITSKPPVVGVYRYIMVIFHRATIESISHDVFSSLFETYSLMRKCFVWSGKIVGVCKYFCAICCLTRFVILGQCLYMFYIFIDYVLLWHLVSCNSSFELRQFFLVNTIKVTLTFITVQFCSLVIWKQ